MNKVYAREYLRRRETLPTCTKPQLRKTHTLKSNNRSVTIFSKHPYPICPSMSLLMSQTNRVFKQTKNYNFTWQVKAEDIRKKIPLLRPGINYSQMMKWMIRILNPWLIKSKVIPYFRSKITLCFLKFLKLRREALSRSVRHPLSLIILIWIIIKTLIWAAQTCWSSRMVARFKTAWYFRKKIWVFLPWGYQMTIVIILFMELPLEDTVSKI